MTPKEILSQFFSEEEIENINKNELILSEENIAKKKKELMDEGIREAGADVIIALSIESALLKAIVAEQELNEQI